MNENRLEELLERDFQSIGELGLSKYAEKLLENSGITTVQQLLSLTNDQLRNIRRIGKKSLHEIETKVSSLR